jgi:hypothetical protein
MGSLALQEWGHRVKVSYSTLCETCRLLGFRPLEARDFARALNALRAATRYGCAPEVLLNVSRRRFLRALSAKAGCDLGGVHRRTQSRPSSASNCSSIRIARRFASSAGHGNVDGRQTNKPSQRVGSRRNRRRFRRRIQNGFRRRNLPRIARRIEPLFLQQIRRRNRVEPRANRRYCSARGPASAQSPWPM